MLNIKILKLKAKLEQLVNLFYIRVLGFFNYYPCDLCNKPVRRIVYDALNGICIDCFNFDNDLGKKVVDKREFIKALEKAGDDS